MFVVRMFDTKLLQRLPTGNICATRHYLAAYFLNIFFFLFFNNVIRFLEFQKEKVPLQNEACNSTEKEKLYIYIQSEQ